MQWSAKKWLANEAFSVVNWQMQMEDQDLDDRRGFACLGIA